MEGEEKEKEVQGSRAAALSQHGCQAEAFRANVEPHTGWTEPHHPLHPSTVLCFFTTSPAAMMSQSLRASVSVDR